MKSFINFLGSSPSSYHAVRNAINLLEENNFKPLYMSEIWNLEGSGKYYLTINDSALIAFKVGNLETPTFRILSSHTDFPCFKLKPKSLLQSKPYLQFNTEVYGGPILSTWMDRSLSLAGRVFVEGENLFQPEMKLIDFEEPLLTIPNLAIHLNREVNKGYEWNPQKDTLPLLGLLEKELDEISFNRILDEKIKSKKILGFDLNLYDSQPPSVLGLKSEFIHSGKLDNLAMFYASLKALIHSQEKEHTSIVCALDHEEIGSASRQGALSPIFSDILKRISFSKGKSYEVYSRALANSFMISADQAHGKHPNYVEKSDPTNAPIINKGPVMKFSSAMNYATDGYTASIIKSVADKNSIPLQTYTNPSNIRGGSTLGPLLSQSIPIATVDMGNPILGMHSVRELGGLKDQAWMEELFTAFLEED